MYLNPVAIQDWDGVPPLPLEVDDDFITRDDVLLIQPGQQYSYMIGFNCVIRLFQILSQCILRQRLLNSAPSFEFNVWVHGEWVQETMDELRQILAGLPPQLRPSPGFQEDSSTSFNGTQAANICITALCVEMALVRGGLHKAHELTDNLSSSISKRASRQTWIYVKIDSQ